MYKWVSFSQQNNFSEFFSINVDSTLFEIGLIKKKIFIMQKHLNRGGVKNCVKSNTVLLV